MTPLLALLVALSAAAPDPGSTDLRWTFEQRVPQGATPGPPELGGGLVTNTSADVVVLASRLAEVEEPFPAEALSVSAWVAVETPRRWGGIVSCIQDNGDHEKGWVLGYDEQGFTFGLSTTGADDGDGRMTYLRAAPPYTPGRWHHVVATFDGTRTRLYVDGALAAETEEQSGEVLYDLEAPVVLAGYRDADEDYPHDGRLLEARIEGEALTSAEVRRRFDARAGLVGLEAWTDTTFGFLVEPYLTWPRHDGVTVLFEATFTGTASVAVRREDQAPEEATLHELGASRLFELHLKRLQPDTKYYYDVLLRDGKGGKVVHPTRAWRTAASPGRAFTFVVIGDTQAQPEVVQRVSDLAYMHRPNLVLHAGDLVGTGTSKADWTGHFFPHMQPLIGYVPLMPVLGNHEQDAEHYYRYMALPEPERWYSFEYGDAAFFMIDGNRSLEDSSAQLEWLEEALSASRALWKFAVLHQPPYTSDSDDYGDTHFTTSHRGDPNARNIAKLLERYGVDLCFSGHVHDYERTFPIREGEVSHHEHGGVIYVTTAGGGGHLEDFDPVNTDFGHKKARYHHLVYLAVNGHELEFQAIDEHGRLFDVLQLTKPVKRR